MSEIVTNEKGEHNKGDENFVNQICPDDKGGIIYTQPKYAIDMDFSNRKFWIFSQYIFYNFFHCKYHRNYIPLHLIDIFYEDMIILFKIIYSKLYIMYTS